MEYLHLKIEIISALKAQKRQLYYFLLQNRVPVLQSQSDKVEIA